MILARSAKRPGGLEPFKTGAYLIRCRDAAAGSVVSSPSCAGATLCLSAPSTSSSRPKLGTSNGHVPVIRMHLGKVGFS